MHADVTIALPLLVNALAASAREIAGRPEAAALRSFGPVMAVDGRPFPQARFEARDR